MRPYMLWLTGMYGGNARGGFTAGTGLETALGDWIRYQSERRFEVEAYRR